jgi:deferrochelatase/peroxidase EfeB
MPHFPPVHPQAGILNRPPDHALFAALSITGGATTDPAQARAALEALRGLVHNELRSQLDPLPPDAPKDQPSAETGELGFADHYDRYHLTITVGLAKRAFELLGIAADEHPQDLRPIDWAKLGDEDPEAGKTVRRPDNGDVLLQVCTDSIYIAEHVVRRVEEELHEQFAVAWVVPGAQRHNSRAGRAARQEGPRPDRVPRRHEQPGSSPHPRGREARLRRPRPARRRRLPTARAPGAPSQRPQPEPEPLRAYAARGPGVPA